MKGLTLFAIALFASVLVSLLALTPAVRSQSGATEAPASFDNQTNGFEPQGTDPTILGTFVGDKAAFEAREEKADGLGPVYNAQACSECHQNRVTGGVSQIMELRAGHSGPDGTFIPAPGGSLIHSRSLNTTTQERVPDGARIACINNSGQVSIMSFDGGEIGVVGNSPVVGDLTSFSPDGTKIVFGRNVSGQLNIWIMNNDGTNLHQVTTSNTDLQPAWSPDGTKIAFNSTRTGFLQIFTMNPDGTAQTKISDGTAQDGKPGWSPDNTQIVFSRTPIGGTLSDLWKMSSTGAGVTQLTNTPTANEGRPTWSPDGTQIAFHTDRDGNWEIYKMTSAGALQTRLTNNAAQDKNPAWAPDNSAIAFSSNRSGILNLWAIAPDGTNEGQLNGNNDGGGDFPAYSRDQGETVRTFRASPILVGLGFVEAIDDSTLLSIRDNQAVAMRGTAISVPLLEAAGQTRIGRFGWKNSLASLLSFSAGAYLNEMGITSPLQPTENTSLGRNTAIFDTVPDPEDTGGFQGFGADVEAFTRFMRSTKAPPRNIALALNDATDPGSALFDSLSCSVCHVRSITTAPAGTVINGGTFSVPEALGNKIIHPFSDFLLHDIGTGDGIVESNGEVTRNKMRTAPLWGLRTRDKFMHDGGSSSAPTNSGAQSFTLNEVVLRHSGQAASSRTAYQALTARQKDELIRFLKSL